MNRLFRTTTLIVAGLSLSASAQASQMQVSRSQLCTVSSAVVVARVIDQETRWTDHADGGIERLVFLDVSNVVAGALGDKAQVVLPGGTLGAQRHWVEDVPNLLVNGTYLLFLDQVDGLWQIVGGDQGAVRLQTDRQRMGETATEALGSVEVCHAK
ncbi:MAG: hypothetical protein GWP91_09145 [Rhodobacterales bacterium]|nr:hypothetical protein [Rhodobacterales bacterium]